jgi:hypothetical protein
MEISPPYVIVLVAQGFKEKRAERGSKSGLEESKTAGSSSPRDDKVGWEIVWHRS